MDGAWDAAAGVFALPPCVDQSGAVKSQWMPFSRLAVTIWGMKLNWRIDFKVESKRADKKFPMTSIQISQEIGGRLAEEYPDTVVDVHNPGYTVYVEIREENAFVHGPAKPGAGGLPTGIGENGAFALWWN